MMTNLHRFFVLLIAFSQTSLQIHGKLLHALYQEHGAAASNISLPLFFSNGERQVQHAELVDFDKRIITNYHVYLDQISLSQNITLGLECNELVGKTSANLVLSATTGNGHLLRYIQPLNFSVLGINVLSENGNVLSGAQRSGISLYSHAETAKIYNAHLRVFGDSNSSLDSNGQLPSLRTSAFRIRLAMSTWRYNVNSLHLELSNGRLKSSNNPFKTSLTIAFADNNRTCSNGNSRALQIDDANLYWRQNSTLLSQCIRQYNLTGLSDTALAIPIREDSLHGSRNQDSGKKYPCFLSFDSPSTTSSEYNKTFMIVGAQGRVSLTLEKLPSSINVVPLISKDFKQTRAFESLEGKAATLPNGLAGLIAFFFVILVAATLHAAGYLKRRQKYAEFERSESSWYAPSRQRDEQEASPA